MLMALSATTIDTALMGLVIAGVTSKTLSTIPTTDTIRECPLIFPDPENWAGDMSLEVRTLTVTTAYWECIRTLNYLYLHMPVGSERGAFRPLKDMSDKRDAIIEQFVEINIAGVDVIGVTSTPLTYFMGPTGVEFHGFRLGVVVRERINA